MKNKICLLVFIVFFQCCCIGQNNNEIDEGIWNIPDTTIEIYLDDTIYFQKHSLWDEDSLFPTYFVMAISAYYELKDGLPDGYYCLYDLKRGDSVPPVLKGAYLVCSGGFKEGKRHGLFAFFDNVIFDDNRSWKCRTAQLITYCNGVVHGTVEEYADGQPFHLAEYCNGVKNGYSLYSYTSGGVLIRLYNNNLIMHQVEYKGRPQCESFFRRLRASQYNR